jgi:ubiquinol-cytochrome c reductase subunit 8
MFRNYLFNGYRRLAGEFIFWALPFSIGAPAP